MASKQKILVTGANGQLGKELKQLCAGYSQFDFVFLSREDLPIENFELARNSVQIHQPQFFINCAAYTAVDKAESEQDLAFLINGEAPGVLAALCYEHGIKFIHVSTDYVFDGMAHTPYKENESTNPQGVYGASKLQGENQVLEYHPGAIIIRTSWVYSEFGKNFVKTMLRLMKEKEEIGVVNDQLGSPTYAADLAEAIMEVVENGKWKMENGVAGIYHYCNAGVISWYDLAVAIKELTGSSCRINPITTSQYPTPAKRPPYSVLDTTKIRETFHIHPKPWKESLQVCLKKIAAQTV